jgi:hypothetical protein
MMARRALLVSLACLAVAPPAAADTPPTQWFEGESIVPPKVVRTYSLAWSQGVAIVRPLYVGAQVPGPAYVYRRTGLGVHTHFVRSQIVDVAPPQVALGGGYAFFGDGYPNQGYIAVYRVGPDTGAGPLSPCPSINLPSSTGYPFLVANQGILVAGPYVYTPDADAGAGCSTWQPQESLAQPTPNISIPGCTSQGSWSYGAPYAITGTTVIETTTACDVYFREIAGAWKQDMSQGLPTGLVAAAGDIVAIASPVVGTGTASYLFRTYSFQSGSPQPLQAQPFTTSRPLTSATMAPGVVFFADGANIYSFVESNGTWTQQTLFGYTAPMAVDGDVAIVHASGFLKVLVNASPDGTTCPTGDAGDAGDGCWNQDCEQGFCCSTKCQGGCGSCASGTCQPFAYATASTCGPYVCDGVNITCPTFCTSDAYCAPGTFCANGTCVPVGDNGSSCTASDQCRGGTCVNGSCHGSTPLGESCTSDVACASGYCADGVCCNAPCDGQCEACDLGPRPGLCAPVAGEPRGGRKPCHGTGSPCAGTCDPTTSTQGCSYSTDPCGASCTRNVDAGYVEVTSACSDGECLQQTVRSCGSYACASDGPRCRASCTTSDDCAGNGNNCIDGACVGGPYCEDDVSKNADPAANGAAIPCAPYACDKAATGKCKQSCDTVVDCAATYVCDPHAHTCVAAPASGDPVSAACGCRVPRSAPTSPGAAFLLCGALGLLSARRGTSRGRSRSGASSAEPACAPSPGRARRR